MQQNIKYGLVGILSVLLGAGAIQFLPADHTYYCEGNNKIAIFEKVSSTGKTGYWYENGTTKSLYCLTKWKLYSKVQNVNMPVKYLCNTENCTKIE